MTCWNSATRACFGIVPSEMAVIWDVLLSGSDTPRYVSIHAKQKQPTSLFRFLNMQRPRFLASPCCRCRIMPLGYERFSATDSPARPNTPDGRHPKPLSDLACVLGCFPSAPSHFASSYQSQRNVSSRSRIPTLICLCVHLLRLQAGRVHSRRVHSTDLVMDRSVHGSETLISLRVVYLHVADKEWCWWAAGPGLGYVGV